MEDGKGTAGDSICVEWVSWDLLCYLLFFLLVVHNNNFHQSSSILCFLLKMNMDELNGAYRDNFDGLHSHFLNCQMEPWNVYRICMRKCVAINTNLHFYAFFSFFWSFEGIEWKERLVKYNFMDDCKYCLTSHYTFTMLWLFFCACTYGYK